MCLFRPWTNQKTVYFKQPIIGQVVISQWVCLMLTAYLVIIFAFVVLKWWCVRMDKGKLEMTSYISKYYWHSLIQSENHPSNIRITAVKYHRGSWQIRLGLIEHWFNDTRVLLPTRAGMSKLNQQEVMIFIIYFLLSFNYQGCHVPTNLSVLLRTNSKRSWNSRLHVELRLNWHVLNKV